MFSRSVKLQASKSSSLQAFNPSSRQAFLYNPFHRSSLSTQVFVANPHKSVAVQRILINNRSRLTRFLATFLEDRQDDEQFLDEKAFLLKQIEALPPAPVEPSERSQAGWGG